MANEEMWDKLFERVDSLKDRLEPTEITAREAFMLALFGLSMSFLLEAVEHPNGARKLKDDIIKALKQARLSPKWIEVIVALFTSICDDLETGKES